MECLSVSKKSCKFFCESWRTLDFTSDLEHVIFSHGDHVPIEVRNAAVVAFWLPDFLGIEYQSMRRADAQEFWSSRASEFCVVAEYVAKRLAAYSWPPEFELRSQYRDLMMHWGICAHLQM